MNSETERPTPPRRFNKRRKETSVTPAIGDRISAGLISTSRILKVLISGILATDYGFFGFLLSSFSSPLAATGAAIFKRGSTPARYEAVTLINASLRRVCR